MFLKTLDHEGHTWTVELRSIPCDDPSGLLEFRFSRGDAGGPTRLTWRVNGDSLDELAALGMEVSEDLLRLQLSLALAEARMVERTVDAPRMC